MLLIHPIGVGLSRTFWHRFCQSWEQQGHAHVLYNPDLLGCGDSDMPRIAYRPSDWAAQLLHFIKTVIQHPVDVVIQGALFPVGIHLVQQAQGTNWIRSLILSGPPSWPLMSQPAKPLKQQILWNLLFDSPLGNAFYRYARREGFLRSFSRRQLFAREPDVDAEWLEMLKAGAQDMGSRYAVFAFLAGFWRQNYAPAIEGIQQPTLVIFGQQASSIDRSTTNDPAQQRLNDYLQHLPNGEGKLIPGRNVLPYESTQAFVDAVASWLPH